MDVILSVLAGLGLRLFLASATDAGPSSKLTTALLGLWEGIVVHQLSGRSASPPLDHVLAYGLRLTVDMLIYKNIQRGVMVVLWSALGTIASEAAAPHAIIRSVLKKERERDKERRHRHSRSVQVSIPVFSAPLPARIRAYKPPELAPATAPTITNTPPLLPPQPPPQSSTPILPTDRPPTPPSFFLQEPESSDIYDSPPPKPIQLQSIQAAESSPQEVLYDRPRSGLASMFEKSPNSGSPLPIPMPLPTPPESAQSAVPSDGLIDIQAAVGYDDPSRPRFERQLFTIPELSSPEDYSTPEAAHQPIHEVPEDLAPRGLHSPTQSPTTTNAPLPVPNAGLRNKATSNTTRWLASQSRNPINADSIFNTPFSPSTSPAAAIPVPLPVRMRVQDPFWQTRTPVDEWPIGHDFLSGEGRVNGHHDDSDSDELCTPGARHHMQVETDNEYDPDPLQTPQQRRPEADDVLSPLALDMGSGLDEQSDRSANPDSAGLEPNTAPQNDPEEDIPIPGSLSLNILLQPPLPPSGPLFRRPTPPPESPPPPSPSTINSGMSEISILSTRAPSKLFSRADQLRQKAREEDKLRSQLEEERKRAERERRTIDALLLKIKVRDKETEVHKLHEKAARRYYAARNITDIPTRIDVHGLRPREAFDRIERAIAKAADEGKTIVRVIVGKGLHSANQQPTLKPAVQREMQRLNLACEVDSRNPGILNITLPLPSTTT